MRKTLVAVMLASSMLFCTVSPFAHLPKNVFDADRSGSSSDEMGDFWNFTSFGNKTYPNGITSQELYHYDDVAILINNNSDASRTIGWALLRQEIFQQIEFLSLRMNLHQQKKQSIESNLMISLQLHYLKCFKKET